MLTRIPEPQLHLINDLTSLCAMDEGGHLGVPDVTVRKGHADLRFSLRDRSTSQHHQESKEELM